MLLPSDCPAAPGAGSATHGEATGGAELAARMEGAKGPRCLSSHQVQLLVRSTASWGRNLRRDGPGACPAPQKHPPWWSSALAHRLCHGTWSTGTVAPSGCRFPTQCGFVLELGKQSRERFVSFEQLVDLQGLTPRILLQLPLVWAEGWLLLAPAHGTGLGVTTRTWV